MQIWQWVKREPGKPAACREHTYRKSQTGDSLLQKLQHIAFSLEDEEALTLPHVTGRMRKAFDVERVTKRFYDRFKKEHDSFFSFITGIPDDDLHRWYASVMLNRLMFIYFVQKKGFLDKDTDYLRNKLMQSRQQGNDLFYKNVLCPLFFEGFAKKAKDRSEEINRLLGEVPYLNGGLFLKHQIEELHGKDIQITDKAFEKLFEFFDQYQWHLNERPLRKDDVSKRTEWNKPAASEYALPTEIWREVVARRQRYEEVKSKMFNGEIRSINDLITYNLDIRQFAQDVIENSEGPELLRAFYHAIENVTALDPTCGSGAFLFAALNILEPLYEACLDRMQVFVNEVGVIPESGLLEGSIRHELPLHGQKYRSDKYGDFKKILKRVEEHPNLKYFIFKSIIVNNLYGVDIMEEAIEICKLRLFLKLVAQIESIEHIEPLPDIDFNIRAGNTLVGFATYDEAKNVVASKLDFDNTMERIKEQAEDVDRLFQFFQKQQTELGGEVAPEDKQALKDKLKVIEDELNQYLAGEYGIDFSPLERGSRGVSSFERGAEVCNKGESNPTLAKGGRGDFQKWLKSHKPFHWFIEFYGILNNGGFDVIIGNPPYVELSKIRSQYTVTGFSSEESGNLYCPMMERGLSLNNSAGRFGMIVPLSIACTERMSSIRNVLESTAGLLWLSHFSGDANPSKLFEGVKSRLDIVLCNRASEFRIFSSSYLKWFAEERSSLFQLLSYAQVNEATRHLQLIPKLGFNIASNILSKLL